MVNQDAVAVSANNVESALAKEQGGGVSVVVHPLVLLSVVDHYNRVAKDTKKRAVGVLLGNGSKASGTIDCLNSFAVPFEEDMKNPDVWYLDHNYLENMRAMFKKVNAKERIVGFYSTGPKIRANDMKICDMMKQFIADPMFVIVDVRPDVVGIPTTAYDSIENVDTSDGRITQVFRHVPSVIGALEAEEVGVEHLLREINDPTVSTVANQVKQKMGSLLSLKEKLNEMKAYLEKVVDGTLVANNQIIYNMQNIFNLLPNLNIDELVKSTLVKTNDMHLVIYLSSLVRSVIALHDLVQNKIMFKDGGIVDDEEEGEKDGKKKGKKGDEESSISKGEEKKQEKK